MLVGLMRIIARRTLLRYIDRHKSSSELPALKSALEAWFHIVRRVAWTSMADVKRIYATASIVSDERVVFNVNGNVHRLVVSIDFENSVVWIKWIGTHAEYNKIDVKEVRYGN